MQVLNVSTVENLTNQVWEKWKSCGYTSQPYALTWMEVNHMANHFLKLCREQNRDYREFDFSMLLDHKLNYEENRAEIENQLGELKSETDKGYLERFNDYVAEDKLAEFSKGEKSKIEEIEQGNKALKQKINQVLKSQESQLSTEKLEELKKIVQQHNDLIISQLERIPDLAKKIEALSQSKNFKELGSALQPLAPAQPAPIKPLKKPLSFPKWLKPQKPVKILDAFAGAMVTLIFLAASAYSLSIWGFGWGLLAGLAGLWMGYVVVFRLTVGGLLD